MEVNSWCGILQQLDARPASSPISLCIDQILFSAEQRDYLVMGALAKNAREIAQACGDPAGEAIIMVHQGVAQLGLGKRASCETLLCTAKGYFRRHPADWARRNQGVAAACIGLVKEQETLGSLLLSKSGASPAEVFAFYSEARENLDLACRSLAESGNVREYKQLYGFLGWLCERIADKAPLVYITGANGSRGMSVSAPGLKRAGVPADRAE